MSVNEIAFFIGLFGSVHCIGMCGPLAFAIPSMQKSMLWMVWDKLLYNTGRIITYTILGLVFGLLGKQLWLAGLQQGISVISGCLIAFAAVSRMAKRSFIKSLRFNALLKPFNQLIVYAINRKAGHLIIGMLNGLLPCGFVYMALIGALNTDSAIAAGKFMMSFGFGTLPLMLVATVGSQMFTQPLRLRLNKVIPYFMLFLGAWFIMRGLNLNIPYLSPDIRTATTLCK